MGHDFGASYPDSQCFGGILYDLDNCDDRGNLFTPLEEIPCPECQHEAWREYYADQIKDMGYEAAILGKAESDCPFPAAAKKYPQDGEWLKQQWISGYRYQKEQANH